MFSTLSNEPCVLKYGNEEEDNSPDNVTNANDSILLYAILYSVV